MLFFSLYYRRWDVFRTRLFRESCVFHRGNYVKDLNKLGRDLQKVIIVDNSPASYIFHPDNAVCIVISVYVCCLKLSCQYYAKVRICVWMSHHQVVGEGRVGPGGRAKEEACPSAADHIQVHTSSKCYI